MESNTKPSSKHAVTTNLFALVPTKAEAEKYKLPQEKVDFFKKNGYLPNNQIINQAQLEQLRATLSFPKGK